MDAAPAVPGKVDGGAMSALPHDLDRCPGDGSDDEGWREGCEDCLRRTAPWDGLPGGGVHMKPPPIIVFECEYRIEP